MVQRNQQRLWSSGMQVRSLAQNSVLKRSGVCFSCGVNQNCSLSGKRRCGTYTQWNITPPLKETFSNMDGPKNYHAKWSQSDNETPTSNAISDTRNLKKRIQWTSCRTDTDSQTLKSSWFPKETIWRVGGCAGGVGWKAYKIGLRWSLHNSKCNKFIE